MNTNIKHIAILLAAAGFLVATTGCTAVRLPWFAKNEDVSSMDSYIAQSASNIQYDTAVDFNSNYQPSTLPAASYAAPKTAPPSGGSGGSCSNGCCN